MGHCKRVAEVSRQREPTGRPHVFPAEIRPLATARTREVESGVRGLSVYAVESFARRLVRQAGYERYRRAIRKTVFIESDVPSASAVTMSSG